VIAAVRSCMSDAWQGLEAVGKTAVLVSVDRVAVAVIAVADQVKVRPAFLAPVMCAECGAA
jgi:cation transport ATPase